LRASREAVRRRARIKQVHDSDLADGFGEVWLPNALAVK
jgi:hypothetical protein